LQLANDTTAFIVDLISLRDKPALDAMFGRIFQSKKTTVIGFGFDADRAQFNKFVPNMKFLMHIENFIDAQPLYKYIFADWQQQGGSSLAAVCERLFKQKLCKGEQMSNWENRRLRHSQEHYAALDAWILPQVMEQLHACASYNGKEPARADRMFSQLRRTIKGGNKQTEESVDGETVLNKEEILKRIAHHEKMLEHYKSMLP
jgi:hypothetical protein